MVKLAEDLKVISDPNRLRILCLLLRGERCVCEVERELEISQQLASHHLNVLKDHGFLRSRKEGASAYYSVVEERLGEITRVFMTYLGVESGTVGEVERGTGRVRAVKMPARTVENLVRERSR